MRKIIKYLTLLLIFLISFLLKSELSLIYAQTNLEVLNKSIENLPTQNKIDVILDSAKKYFNTDISKSVYFAELAVSIIDNKITDESKADVYGQVSNYYYTQGNYSKALEYILMDLKILENLKGDAKLKIARCCVNIGELYRAATDYNSALQYLDTSVSLYSEMKNDDGSKGLSHSYERLAAVYFELAYTKDSSFVYKGIDYASKSLELSWKYGLKIRMINNWNILGACQIFLANYDKALDIFMMALKESYEDSTYADRSNLMNNIASCYFHMGDYKNTIKYAQQSYDESKKRGVAIYVREASFFLFMSYIKLRDFDKTMFYIDEYNRISLELFSHEKNKALSQLEQKNEKEKIDEAYRYKRNELIYISSGILIIIIILFLFIYLRQRALKKINKELEAMNKTITEQKSELEEVNAIKNKFFSILAHDLRNPFNGILGFLSLLKNDFDTLSNQEKKQYLTYVSSSADQVFKLLERLLQLSRLQEGRYVMNIEEVNLNEIAGQIYKLQETNAVNKRVELFLNLSDNLYVKADKISLDTVLRNLIDNAIKFTSAGGKVEIYSRTLENSVEITVSDNGVGMEKEDIENVFRMDKKIVSLGTNNEKGTGLGLVVCKELIEKMNGEIKIQSEFGSGSRFTIVLPK